MDGHKAVRIVIPLIPVTKKNSQRIVMVKGHPIIMPSKKFVDYQKACALYVHPLKDPINYGINLKALFYTPTLRRCDLTNHLEAISDILVHYHVLKDDDRTIVWSVDGSRVLYDKFHPRTEIEITPIEEEK